MNLVKELKRISLDNYQRELAETEATLDSVKAHLGQQDKETADLLIHFGTSEVVNDQTKKKQRVSELMKGGFVREHDIRRLCINYALRFLDAGLYKKEIPFAVLDSLRNFKEENKLSDQKLRNNLYVIAPASHFVLGPRPAKDPVLLYRVASEQYVVVDTWGSDFNLFRRLLGWFLSRPLVYGLLLSNIFFLFLATYFHYGAFLIGNAVCSLVVLIMAIANEEDGIWAHRHFWNNAHKKG